MKKYIEPEFEVTLFTTEEVLGAGESATMGKDETEIIIHKSVKPF